MTEFAGPGRGTGLRAIEANARNGQVSGAMQTGGQRRMETTVHRFELHVAKQENCFLKSLGGHRTMAAHPRCGTV